MIRRLALAVILTLSAAQAQAQDPTATATLSSTTCPGTGCVSLSSLANRSMATVEVSGGAWTGTLLVEITASATNVDVFAAGSKVPSSGITANGVYQVPMAGASAIRVRASVLSSGTPTVKLTAGQGSADFELPVGASTSAKQDTGNVSLSSIDTKTPSLVSGRVPVDGSGVTQPVSGAFFQATQPVSAASLPLPTGAATSANQTTGNNSLSSIDGKLPATVAADRTTAAAPGAARLSDGSSFYKATTPSDTQPISAASLPLPTGAATSANQTNGTQLTRITDGSTTAPVPSDIPVGTEAGLAVREVHQLRQSSSANTMNAANQFEDFFFDITGTKYYLVDFDVSGGLDATCTFATSRSAFSAAGGETDSRLVWLRAADQYSTSNSNRIVFTGSTTAHPLVMAAVPPGHTQARFRCGTFNSGSATFRFSASDTSTVEAISLALSRIGNVAPNYFMALAGRDSCCGPTMQPLDSYFGRLKVHNADPANDAGFVNIAGNGAAAVVKGASTAAVASDPALVVAISPNNTPVLPSGAATSANQATEITALQLIDNLPNTLGSTTSGQSGALGLGAVTTTAPSYTNGRSDALSLTTAGNLRVDGSSVTQPISASSLPLPTGAATEASLSTANANLDAIVANTQATVTQLQNGGDPLIVTLGGATQPVSAASLPLPTGASTSATQTDRTQKTQLTDGTRDGTVKAASTLPLLTDTAVVTTQRDPLPAGTNVIGHTINDTGSTTAVTGNVAVTNAGLTNLDVALSTRTKPADQQHAIIDSGTTVVTQATAANLNVQVKAADGDVFVRQATAANLNALVAQGAPAAAGNRWPVTVSDGTNSMPTMDASTRAGFVKVTDGTDTAEVKAGSSGAATADPSVVISQSPNGTIATLSAWNSGTALNATQSIVTVTNVSSVLVYLVQTTTLTAGAINFELTYDNTNWVTIPADAVTDPTSTTQALIPLPYTVQASTNKAFMLQLKGAQGLRIKLTTQITGTGTVTPNYELFPNAQIQTVNQTQVNGVAVSTGSGVSDTGTQRVTMAQEATYSAGLTAKTATAAGTAPFFEICGSASKTIRLQRISISGTVATAAVWGDVILSKRSAASTGGTATTLTNTPYDSNSAAATATVKYYTVLPTAGTLVGTIYAVTQLFPVTAISATLQPTPAPLLWTWRDQDAESPTLRGTGQCVTAHFGTTTTNAPTLTVSVAWTEK